MNKCLEKLTLTMQIPNLLCKHQYTEWYINMQAWKIENISIGGGY